MTGAGAIEDGRPFEISPGSREIQQGEGRLFNLFLTGEAVAVMD